MLIRSQDGKTYVGTLWTEREGIIANRVVFQMLQDDEVEV